MNIAHRRDTEDMEKISWAARMKFRCGRVCVGLYLEDAAVSIGNDGVQL